MLIPRRETARVRVDRYRLGGEEGEDAARVTGADDVVATEEPMEIRVSCPEGEGRSIHSVAVTMRTPGHDFQLAAGFLFTEGLIRKRRDITRISYCAGDEPQEYNLVEVRLRADSGFDPSQLQRNFYMTSSCGICGKASLEAVENLGCRPFPLPGGNGGGDMTLEVAAPVVARMPDALRAAQPVFGRTGGLHAAGLFDATGRPGVVREDVGRHNAVDKVVGDAFLGGDAPLLDRILVVSGRVSFEILQKAVMAGVPMVVAVGAPSSLAVDFARRFRMTLVGFTRPGGFNVYTGGERVLPDGPHSPRGDARGNA